MVVPPLFRSTLLLLAACTTTGCASGPTLPRELAVVNGQPTAVALHQIAQTRSRNDLTLTLVNLSALPERPDRAIYEADSRDPGLKFLGDDELQALLDVLAAKGMFAVATPTPAPDAIDVLVVEHGGRRWTWSRRQRGMQVAEQSFHEARAYFMAAYNSVVAYHGTGSGRPDLESEAAQKRRAGNAARRSLQDVPNLPPPAVPPPSAPQPVVPRNGAPR